MMMYDLTGYMTLNGKDAWTEYFAFLCEDRREDNFNFGELLKPLEMKEYTAVDFRERNGEELPDELPDPCYKARDLTLYIAVQASSMTECRARSAAFVAALRAGWVNLKIKELPAVYKLYYKTVTDAKIVSDVHDGTTFACIKVKFREPKPGGV